MVAQVSLSGRFIGNMMDNLRNKNHSSIDLKNGVVSSTQKTCRERNKTHAQH